MRTTTRAVPHAAADELLTSVISHMQAACQRLDHLWRAARRVEPDECGRCGGTMVPDGRDAHLVWTHCTSCRSQIGVRRAP